jgi:carboxylate-amine ligase
VRTVGVEEELLLVDPTTWRVTAVAQQVLGLEPEAERSHGDGQDGEPDIEAELHQHQLEVATAPVTDLGDLRHALVERRRAAQQAAERAGVLAVATPTPLLPNPSGRLTPRPRYRRIGQEFGEITAEAFVCGMHVHVSVADDEEAVAVVDRTQPWLPVLLALSANSPYWNGSDSGYASWRSHVWARWPTGGAHEAFGSVEEYRRVSETLQEWGAALDEGMLYYDVRLARDLPTVEVRVADVCTEVDEAVLLTALARALVMTVADEHRSGSPAPEGPWRADLLRAAHWRASRDGVAGELVHPVNRRTAPAAEVAAALVGRVSDALDETGDRALVDALLPRLLADRGGAGRQRAVAGGDDDLGPVVADLARRTHAG